MGLRTNTGEREHLQKGPDDPYYLRSKMLKSLEASHNFRASGSVQRLDQSCALRRMQVPQTEHLPVFSNKSLARCDADLTLVSHCEHISVILFPPLALGRSLGLY